MIKSFWILGPTANGFRELSDYSWFVCVCVCVLGGRGRGQAHTTAVWLQDEAGQLGIIELFICPDLTQSFLVSARLACDVNEEEWTSFYPIETKLFWHGLSSWTGSTHGFEYGFDFTMKDVLKMLNKAVHCICSVSGGGYSRSWGGENTCTPGHQ